MSIELIFRTGDLHRRFFGLVGVIGNAVDIRSDLTEADREDVTERLPYLARTVRDFPVNF